MKFAKVSRSPNSFRFLLILSKNIIRVLCKISFLDLNKEQRVMITSSMLDQPNQGGKYISRSKQTLGTRLLIKC